MLALEACTTYIALHLHSHAWLNKPSSPHMHGRRPVPARHTGPLAAAQHVLPNCRPCVSAAASPAPAAPAAPPLPPDTSAPAAQHVLDGDEDRRTSHARASTSAPAPASAQQYTPARGARSSGYKRQTGSKKRAGKKTAAMPTKPAGGREAWEPLWPDNDLLSGEEARAVRTSARYRGAWVDQDLWSSSPTATATAPAAATAAAMPPAAVSAAVGSTAEAAESDAALFPSPGVPAGAGPAGAAVPAAATAAAPPAVGMPAAGDDAALERMDGTAEDETAVQGTGLPAGGEAGAGAGALEGGAGAAVLDTVSTDLAAANAAAAPPGPAGAASDDTAAAATAPAPEATDTAAVGSVLRSGSRDAAAPSAGEEDIDWLDIEGSGVSGEPTPPLLPQPAPPPAPPALHTLLGAPLVPEIAGSTQPGSTDLAKYSSSTPDTPQRPGWMKTHFDMCTTWAVGGYYGLISKRLRESDDLRHWRGLVELYSPVMDLAEAVVRA